MGSSCDRGDDVALHDAAVARAGRQRRLRGRPAALDAHQRHAMGGPDARLISAPPPVTPSARAHRAAVADQARHDAVHLVDRVAKPMPALAPEGLKMAVFTPVSRPARIEQRAAGVARVDGRDRSGSRRGSGAA